jgi:metal-sulfur cluster biosynthetic enzyme
MNEHELKEQVIERLRTIYDPEIPVNIYELGLIYEVNVLPISNVQIVMTLTIEVDQKLREIEGVNDVHVAVTWNPPWDKSMMSEAAQLELGML